MPTVKGNKPGWKKTEFWIKVCTVDLPLVWLSVKQFVAPKDAIIIEVVAGTVFTIFNTVQKALENWKNIKQTRTDTTATVVSPAMTTTTTQP